MGSGLDGFSEPERATLRALIDTVIPEDEWPGGWDGGVARLLVDHGDGFLAHIMPILRDAVAGADSAAMKRSSGPFSELSHPERTELFGALLDGESSLAAPPSPPVASAQPFTSLVTIGFQGFYAGTAEPAGWKMVGYSALPEGVVPIDSSPPAGIAASELEPQYDVIVIGAGGGGGVAAAELAKLGQRVLLVERARPMRDRDLRGNHLQGKRTAAYDPLAGPHAGNPRLLERIDGSIELLRGEGNGHRYGLVAMALGGGTRLWQGMSWRFWEQDFAMASVYGVPAGSTLVDWPFGYDELAPYYDRAEWELGVSGDATSAVGLATPRMRDYPMPPLPSDATRESFARAAERLGWQASPIPFSINSVPREGRAACVRCSQCIGHSCPVNAKNGTHNTFIPRAIATGRCDLLMSAQVVEIEHDGRGTATGVRMMIDTGPNTDGSPVSRTVRARRIVVSAGAVETPRLLLASGLGNDWVGRNHHSHGFALAYAATAPDVKSTIGPGHSVASLDRVHHNGEAWGGGVLFDYSPPFPSEKAELGRVLSGARFGEHHKRWMRESPLPLGAMSMVQEIPHETSRIRIDRSIADRFGMPAARLSGRPHPATIEAVHYMSDAAATWVTAAGGSDIRTVEAFGNPQGSEHSAGTARMGNDPALSATNSRGLLWGTTNVFVADASLHPTNGGFNPALTVMANAMRVAELMVREG